MLQTFDKPDLQEDFRKTLTAFYTVLKDADPYLQFVFITGVTKFAQMGIFSTLNQLNDISFDLEYNTLCGMTRAEIETVFVPELQELALQTETNYGEAVEQLTRQYDGYRFLRNDLLPCSILSVCSTLLPSRVSVTIGLLAERLLFW